MDAARFAALVRRWWWLAPLAAVIAVAAYGVASRVQASRQPSPSYRAQATLYIVPVPVRDVNENITAGIQRSYAQLLTGPDIAGDAGGRVKAEAVAGTQLIDVSARAATPAEADELLSAVLIKFARLRPQQEFTGDVLVYDRVAPVRIPSDATPLPLALALVALAGIGGAAAIVLVYERLAQIIRTADDAEAAVGAPLLAAVPADTAMIMHDDAGSPGGAAERYRLLRTNVRTLAGGEDPRSVLFVSPRAHGPAAGVAANYAVALAQAGQRVALLEANLRAPVLHEIFGTGSQIGLAEALSEGLALDAAAMPLAPAVALITAGRVPPDPSALLDSPRFAALLAELRERFDCVVLDCAPALEFADAAIIASHCDAAVLALGQETSRADAGEAARTLRVAGARILGVVTADEASGSIWRSPAWSLNRRRTAVAGVQQ